MNKVSVDKDITVIPKKVSRLMKRPSIGALQCHLTCVLQDFHLAAGDRMVNPY